MNEKLSLTKKMIDSCANAVELMELPAIKNRFANTVNLTRAIDFQRAETIFEAEKAMFVQKLQDDPKLGNCTKVSIYQTFLNLAISGLSLRDEQAYLIPRKDKLTLLPSWKGRLEQMQQIPTVKHINEPICVFDGEEFDFEIIDGEVNIKYHKPILETEGKKILAVYMKVEFSFGSKTYLMRRDDVISIRDRYSESYKYYISTPINENGKRIKKGKYGDYEVEAPAWVTDEQQMFKKTLVRRVYNSIPKTASQKVFDEQIKEAVNDVTDEIKPKIEVSEEDIKSVSGLNDIAEETQFEEVPGDKEEKPKDKNPESAEQPKIEFNQSEEEDTF